MTGARRLLGRALVLAAVGALLWRSRDEPVRLIGPGAAAEAVQGVYVDAGESLLHGVTGGYVQRVNGRMPLASMGSVWLFAHGGPRRRAWALGAVQSAWLGCFTALAFLAGGAPGALASLALLRASPDAWPGDTYSHFLYSLLILLVAGLLLWRERRRSPARDWLLGAAIGASLLYRSPLALLPPLLLALEAARGGRPALRRALAPLLLAPYLGLLPWAAMNYSVYGRLALFEDRAADSNVMTGAVGIVKAVEGTGELFVDSPPAPGESVGLWAARTALAHPFRYLGGVARRAGYALTREPALTLLALLACVALRGRPGPRPLAGFASYFIGVHCLISLQDRYLIPLWPLLAALAGSLAAPLWDRRPESGRAGDRVAAFALLTTLAAASALGLSALTAVVRFPFRGEAAMGRPEALERALEASPDDAWLLAERGRSRLASGDPAGGRTDLERSVRLFPDFPGRALELAWAKALAGDAAGLLAFEPGYGNLGAGVEGRLKPHLYKAAILFRQGRRAEARAELEAALAVREAQYLGGGAREQALEAWARDRLRRSGGELLASQWDEVLAALPPRERVALLGELRALRPRDPGLLLRHARGAAAAGDAPAALDSLERLFVGASNAAAAPREPFLAGAELFRTLGRARRADEALALLTRLYPDDVELRLRAAEAAERAGRREEAIRALEAAERLALGQPEALRRVALLLARVGPSERASGLYRRLSALEPRNLDLWLERAEAAAVSGDRAGALEALATVERLAVKGDRPRRSRAAAAYGALRLPGERARLLEEIGAAHPYDDALRLERAVAALQAGDRARGHRLLEETQARARDPQLRRELALRWQEAGESGKALAVLEPLAAAAPREASFHRDLGVVRCRAGDAAGAERSLREALALDPRDPAAGLSLGAVYSARGRWLEALEVYERALAGSDPGSELGRLLSKSRAEAARRTLPSRATAP